MTQDDVIEIACRIVNMVWNGIDPDALTPSDCFCRHAVFTDRDYCNGGLGLTYVRDAVVEKLKRDGLFDRVSDIKIATVGDIREAVNAENPE